MKATVNFTSPNNQPLTCVAKFAIHTKNISYPKSMTGIGHVPYICSINNKQKYNTMATKWNLDPTHSEITFKVKHMMISNIKGNFRTFTAEIESEDDTFSNAKTTATIQTDSVFTNNTDRDNHLKSAEFFNTEEHPSITFESQALNNKVTGNLTVNGITKPITLDVDFGGINIDPWGNTKAGFSFEGKINRKDFGLNWNAALEAGGVMVSEEVKIAGELQFVKQA